MLIFIHFVLEIFRLAQAKLNSLRFTGYHCQCIDPWLTKAKRVCPLCKRRVLSDDESVCSNVPAREFCYYISNTLV